MWAFLYVENMSELKVGHATATLMPFDDKRLSKESMARLYFLSHVFVPKEHRRKGAATKLLAQIAKEADEAQIAVLLEPKAFDDEELSGDDLIMFYSRNGYQIIQDEPLLMIRYATPLNLIPKKTVLAILDRYGNTINS